MTNITVLPTLFVGFGGSGAKALSAIKKSLKEILTRTFKVETVDLPPCFQFLQVDIDERDAAENFFKPASPDFLNCSPNTGFDKLDNRIEEGNGVYSYIKPWWPKGLGHAIIENNPGAEMKEGYRVRHLGRVALWLKAKDFKSMVEKFDGTCCSDDTRKKVAQMYSGGLIIENKPVQVCVVASIAGGTGCGMIIDGLAMLHSFIRKTSGIRTYLLLPSVYSTVCNNATEPLVNAYAALKEYDHFYLKNKYKAQFDKNIKVEMSDGISSYTYLFGGRTEGNMVFLGDGNLVCQKVARLIVNSVCGFSSIEGKLLNQEDPSARPARYSLNGGYVSSRYQSLGVQEVRYPDREMKEYIQTYAKQLLAAYLRKLDERMNDIKKYAPQGNPEVCAKKYASQGIISQCMTIARIPSAHITNTQADNLLAKPKALVVDKIRHLYETAKSEVDANYADSDQDWQNVKQQKIEEARTWIYQSIGAIFCELKERVDEKKKVHPPEGGFNAVVLFLQFIAEQTQLPVVSPMNELSDEVFKEMQEEFLAAYPWFLSFDETKVKYIRDSVLLAAVRQNIDERIDHYCKCREKEIADAIYNIVTECRKKIDSLGRMLNRINAKCYEETQAKAKDMDKHASDMEWIGCSAPEIKDLKEKIRDYVKTDYKDLALKIGDIIGKVPDEPTNEFDLKEIESVMEKHAEAVLGVTSIYNENLDVMDHLQEFIGRKNRPSLKEGLQDYLADAMAYAQPMNQIDDTDGTIFKKWIIVNISDVKKKILEQATGGDTVENLPYMDSHSMLFVQLRGTLIANDLLDIREYYEAYRANDKNPAPNKYSEINLSSHLFDTSTWPELIKQEVTDDDIDVYFKLGKKLGVIVKSVASDEAAGEEDADSTETASGKKKTTKKAKSSKETKSSWWNIINPEKGTVIKQRLNGELKVKEYLKKNLDVVKNVLIEVLRNKYTSSMQGDYTAAFGEKKTERSKFVPEAIESYLVHVNSWEL